MQEVEVVIDESGLTCTTVNPLGEKPVCDGQIKYGKKATDFFKWKQAESERKMYKIDNIQCTSNSENNKVLSVCLKPSRLFQENFRWVEIGSIHKAKIINGKATIL